MLSLITYQLIVTFPAVLFTIVEFTLKLTQKLKQRNTELATKDGP